MGGDNPFSFLSQSGVGIELQGNTIHVTAALHIEMHTNTRTHKHLHESFSLIRLTKISEKNRSEK